MAAPFMINAWFATLYETDTAPNLTAKLLYT
jgi:hypothetical protein